MRSPSLEEPIWISPVSRTCLCDAGKRSLHILIGQLGKTHAAYATREERGLTPLPHGKLSQIYI